MNLRCPSFLIEVKCGLSMSWKHFQFLNVAEPEPAPLPRLQLGLQSKNQAVPQRILSSSI